MADELFSRLSAIGSIIGGTGTLDFNFEEPEPTPELVPTSKVGMDFTGGTLTEAKGDSHGETPGARALQNHLLGRFAGGHDSGVYSDRDVRGRPGVRSVHGVGRAGDFGIRVGDPLGDQVAAYLVENADRFGVQRIIFNRKSWNRNTRKWVAYNGENPHTDHVHWEITPEAADRTDLYDGAETTKAPNRGDVLSRMKSIHDVVSGGSARRADAEREKQGYGNLSKDMAQRFAMARRNPGAAPAGGGSTATIEGGSKGKYQQYAISRFADYGWTSAEASALIDLWNRESGWNPNAQNPTSTAYGIAQFLNGTWRGVGASKTSDPFAQIDAGLRYIKQRFGTPTAALAFHRSKGWY